LETVVISVDKAVYPNLGGQKYYSGFVSERTIGDQIEMTFLTISLDGFARWYMMFGDRARILQPDSLREKVKTILENFQKKL
jgi:predicted DNA-binding transcriptional regulator YafY